jgi:hypothetical protein
MSKFTMQDLKDALAQPSPQAGWLLLKQRCGMTLAEAKEAMSDAQEAVAGLSGMRAEEAQAVAEAMNAVDTFDELTALMLRHMRDTKQPIAARATTSADVLQQCAVIYDVLKTMIANDVNPGRAMTAFVLKVNHTNRVPADDAADVLLMQEVIAQRLRDDLLTLL